MADSPIRESLNRRRAIYGPTNRELEREIRDLRRLVLELTDRVKRLETGDEPF